MKTALTIAGSDCSGGAGIQADIKTMTANGVYAMSAITALTAQNTLGVADIMGVTPEFLSTQLDCIFTDIFPNAVKIGMVADEKLIEVICHKLSFYEAKNIVCDPVMLATSGASLSSSSSVLALKKNLFPLSDLITPNIFEAEVLSGIKISTAGDMEAAAKKIYEENGCGVLLKGGHSLNDANDFLYSKNTARWFLGKRIDNLNTHGTGCTLSSAIASFLADGQELEEAIENAKGYLSCALSSMLNLGKGSGPLNHSFTFDK